MFLDVLLTNKQMYKQTLDEQITAVHFGGGVNCPINEINEVGSILQHIHILSSNHFFLLAANYSLNLQMAQLSSQSLPKRHI